MLLGALNKMLRKILSLDSNFKDKRRKPLIQKIDDSIYVVENFLPEFYENILENVFLSNNILTWNKVENIAFAEDRVEYSKDTVRKGYSHIMADEDYPFPYPKSEAFHFVFPMVLSAFDVVGLSVKNFITSRAFLTEPIYIDKEPIHIDVVDKHWTCLYYPHTIDGDTVFMEDFYPDVSLEESKNYNFTEFFRVTPKKGRCVLFDGCRYHSSYRSKKAIRVVINCNVVI